MNLKSMVLRPDGSISRQKVVLILKFALWVAGGLGYAVHVAGQAPSDADLQLVGDAVVTAIGLLHTLADFFGRVHVEQGTSK